jgi:hypothetical protein
LRETSLPEASNTKGGPEETSWLEGQNLSDDAVRGMENPAKRQQDLARRAAS